MQRHSPREVQRKRTGQRTLVACFNCKDRKLRCDDQIPACANCQRLNLGQRYVHSAMYMLIPVKFVVCLVEDPATKRHLPRNYLETLEQRVAQLERTLQQDSLTTCRGGCQEYTQNHQYPSNGQLPAHTPARRSPKTAMGSVDETEVRDLAAELGMLSVAAGAEPHYLGPSSTVGFARVIHSALLGSIPRRNMGVRRTGPGGDSLPGHCLLPDSNSCVKLSDAYFQHIHTQYPFIHEPSFRLLEMKLLPSQVTDMWQLSSVSLFFLYMVYAIGALLLPDSGYSSEQLYSTAQLYADEVLQLESLETIQAYLCFAVYSLRSPVGTSVWRFSGLALRQCIELGYHRHHKVTGLVSDPLRLELRKRVFWCAWTIDCMCACILGRPLALRNQEFDCEYPLDIEDAYISSHGISRNTRTADDPPTSLTKGLGTFRIRSLWGKIQVSLYSNISTNMPSHPTYQERLDELRSELDALRLTLPCVAPSPKDTLSIFSSDWWYEFCYNYTILYLYRGQLMDPNRGAAEEAYFESMKAASELCHGIRSIVLNRKTTFTWGALHTVFTAGLTYLHCLWSSPAVRAATRQDAVNRTCTACTVVLVLMAQWHEPMVPYREIFEALASRTMTMLIESDVDKPAPSPNTGEFQADLMQWVADISDVGLPASFEDLLAGFINEAPGRY
ncbi:putative transcriptional activator protein acu-15 [Trichoderma velutinum]